MRLAHLALATLVPVAAAAAPLTTPLTTEGERSGYVKTGRYQEVIDLCAAFARSAPRQIRCITFGHTPEKRPMVALVASADGTLDPALARKRGRPVVLVQSGIHAGEIEGKDALFWLLRELQAGKVAPGALAAVTLVAVPVFNVDGHERFGPGNRPNQRGPEEMGFRATAQNLNLNRDYMKADAPEMRAMLGLLRDWDPAVTVDLHTTDGAKFEHDISVMVDPEPPRTDGLDAVAGKLSDELQAGLTAAGHLPLPFYPSFKVNDDPSSGFENDGTPPRFSQAYAATRNRIGILVETHSWKTYKQRVESTRDTLITLLEHARTEAAGWRAAERAADDKNSRLAGTDVDLLDEPDGKAAPFDFHGYAYTVEQSAVSGGKRIIYDETKPQIWRVPLIAGLRPKLTVHAPAAGYVVPAAWAGAIAPILQAHGLRFTTLQAAQKGLPVSVFQIDELTYDKPFEGRLPVTVQGAWRPEQRDLAPGALFVPLDQPLGLLVLQLCEPQAPDSFVHWGFFNAVFERKEYIEGYVLEDEARKMLQDPAVKADFERRLKEDAKFAASPERRMLYFWKRHASWNEGQDKAPILRVDAVPH